MHPRLKSRVCQAVSSLRLAVFCFLAAAGAFGGKSQAQNLVGHWKFDETRGVVAGNEIDDNSNGLLMGFPVNASPWINGRIGGALTLNCDGNTNEVVIVPDSEDLNFATNGAFTLAAWVRSVGPQLQSDGILAKGFGNGGEEYAIDLQNSFIRFFVRDKRGISIPLTTSAHLTGRWQHIVANFDGEAGTMNVFVDGVRVALRLGPRELQTNSHALSIGNRQSGTNTDYDLPFKGVIDDVRIYNRALTAEEIKSLYQQAGPMHLTFLTVPQGVSLHTGESAVFTALGDGSGPLSYQWKKKGAAVLGANGTVLQIFDVQFDDDGDYSVTITDTNAASISAPARLKVNPFYWQSWWFRSLAVFAAILIVAAIVGLRERQKGLRALSRVERQHAIDRERMRIARDMHDEIGGKLSRVSLLNEMVRRGLPEGSPVNRHIDEVSNATQDIIHTVDEIVWAVNPRHDNVPSLIHYIRRHAEEFFDLTDLNLEFKQPAEIPEHQVPADMRHQLFCAVKEALNNVLKHAGAKNVQIDFSCSDDHFGVTVRDDGRGFEPAPVKSGVAGSALSGDGLINMSERMEAIGGEYTLSSSPGYGTTIQLIIKLR